MLAMFFPLEQFFSRQKSKVFTAYLVLVWRLGNLVSAVLTEAYGEESKHGQRTLYARAARFKEKKQIL